MTTFTQQDHFSETSDEWSNETSDDDDDDHYSSDDDSTEDDTDDSTEDELYEEEEHEIERDSYDNDWDNEIPRQYSYRLLSIITLSCTLLSLLIALGVQLKEYLNIDPSNTSQPFHAPLSNPSTSQSTHSNNYVLPRDRRIYTHTSLSSKNYRAGGILSDEMLSEYERDGVIVLRNLIPPQLIQRLEQAGDVLIDREKSKKRGRQFHLVKNGAIFLGVPSSTLETTCSSDTCTLDEAGDAAAAEDVVLSSFRDVAMYSKVPRVAASLLRLDEQRVGGAANLNLGSKRSRERSQKQNDDTTEENEYVVDDSINLRICRDIFLTKDDDSYACGWHVDDTGFWPSVADDIGVNAWIALDDMPWPWSTTSPHVVQNDAKEDAATRPPVATFALSLGSHTAPWKHEAYRVTGSTHTQPPEGFQSANDLIERRTGSGTCNIQTAAPDLYEKLEERKVIYDLKKGDVIFHDRWLFHRTVTVDEYSQMAGTTAEATDKIFKRYSIRYSPGTARVPPGYGFELSALHNPDNANSTLDEIVERDGPFYPKVWPHVTKKDSSDVDYAEEIEGLTELVYEKIPRAEQIQKERKREVNRLLSARGRP